MNEELFTVWDYFHSELSSLFAEYRHPGGGPGAKDQQHIAKIIEVCSGRAWNVFEYVRYGIGVFAQDHRVATLKDIARSDMIAAYAEPKDDEGRVPSASYEVSYRKQANWVQAMCKRSPSMYKSPAAVLHNMVVPLDAWFRVCYLEETPMSLYDNYGEAGWRQIRENRRLLAALRNVAPKQLENLEHEFGGFGL
jgi:hypothetical protein